MLARSPITEADLSGVAIDYSTPVQIGEKGEYFSIRAYAATREELSHVMADYLESHAKYEPRFSWRSVFENERGFYCRGRQYRYDVATGRT